MTLRIYLAAPLAMFTSAVRYAERLVDGEHVICSHWHDNVEVGQVDPHDEATRREVLLANLADLESADMLFAITSLGKPRATFGEIAWAICRAKPVLWLQGPRNEGGNIFDAHPLVTVVRNHAEVLPALTRIENDFKQGRAA